MPLRSDPAVCKFLEWLQTQSIQQADSTLLFEDMLSQSGESLPVVYQPFDPLKKGHWHDAGLIQDFLLTAACRNGRVLDFGPGDGWPSLSLSPFVSEVVGVDASSQRVAICRENARRMGISNACFVHYAPGSALPFEDAAFDAVVAASSLEQCPDIPQILQEIHRVLKPGGRLRMRYETLAAYAGEQEIEVWLNGGTKDRCGIMIYLRDIPGEKVDHYYLRLRIAYTEALSLLGGDPGVLTLEYLLTRLNQLGSYLEGIYTYTLRHPSGASWAALLREAGFPTVEGTHDAGKMAVQLAGSLPQGELEQASLHQANEWIAQAAPYVCFLPAPIQSDPMILAMKEPEGR